jgi:2',3'-cyclic-nucleotide 2'-phosphodiesterase (5'-nucleotidase family)
MRIKIKHFVIFLFLMSIYACKETSNTLTKLEVKEIEISENLPENDSILNFIKPFKDHLNTTLDVPLAYSPKTLSKSDGHLNTPIGNLMADIVMEMSNPIFNSRTGKNIDFVLLNHGGIRAIISKGNVTTRTTYQVMPFENKIVVVEITAAKVKELLNYLANKQKAHPVSNIQIILNNNTLKSVLIKGEPLDENKTYFVATSDYLANLGDNMFFFKDPISVTDIDYLIRNEMIDYFKKVDTIAPVIDERFIKL